MSATRATSRCSSASRAPARRRCRPIPKRTLIGDDEHGWGPHGMFNFEGGCYAKTIKLSRRSGAGNLRATKRFGTVLENVGFDPDTRICDFDDESKTENTRSAYPLDYIPNASRTGRAGQPKNLMMLTADAYGVMPPIAKLTPAQAMYHFLSGYTAKVAGTEKGLVGVEPEFSTCFGAPFLPRHPVRLRQSVARPDRQVQCRLLAGEHGLDRRAIRRRQAHADQGDARTVDRRARRLAQQCQIPHRSLFRFRGPDLGAGHRVDHPLSVEDLGREVEFDRPRASSWPSSRRTSCSSSNMSTRT